MADIENELLSAATCAWLGSLTDGGRRLVLVRDADRQTVYLSDNAERLTGYPEDEFAQSFYSIVHPDDQGLLFEASHALRTLREAERRMVIRTGARDGSFTTFDMHLQNRLDDPDVAGLVAVLTPVPPVFGAADRWAQLLAVSSELVVIRHADRTGYVSPSVERILGVNAEKLIATFPDLVDADALIDFREARDRALATEHGEARTRTRIRCVTGEVRDFDVTFANHTGDGLIDGLLIRARDITDLVATERRLDRTEARFEALVANSPGAAILVDAAGEILFCSAGVRRLVGHEPDELVGTNIVDHVHPDDLEQATSDFGFLLSHAGTPDRTLRVRRADGSYEWIEVSASNRLHDPSLQALVLSMHNVTERVHADHRMQRLLRDSAGGALVLDATGAVTWTTPGVERFIGEHRLLTPETVGSIFDAHDGDIVEIYQEMMRSESGTSVRVIGRIAPDATKRWVDITLTNAFDDPAIAGVIVNIRDVDEAVRAAETGHRLTEVLENTTDLVCVFDESFDLIWANASAGATLGDAPLPRDIIRSRISESTLSQIERDVVPSLKSAGRWSGELTIVDRSGAEVPIEVTVLTHRNAGGVEFVSAIARDISERKALEAQLHAKARHDPLTGLPNRAFLSESLERLIADDEPVALMFIDLDQFKAVNDTQGHDAGDHLLEAAANRLRAALRPSDLVARFGGDEFIVLLPGVTALEQALSLGERVLDRLRGAVRIGTIEVYLTASAGIALSDGSDSSTLISNADAAMYKAKASGRDRIAAFSAELRDLTTQRLETAHQLREAIEADEIDVWFQPIVDTATNLPVALEALARWEHADQGMISPAHFVLVAEETGLIRALGAAVIRRTCQAIGQLGRAATAYTFSINLSAHQLTDESLIDALAEATSANGVDPRQIFCEVTESAVMHDLAGSIELLDRIRSLGIRIAIDDFGTGHSSLAYLHRLPVDVLKIDREFVGGLTFDTEWDRSLAAGIVSLGHSLGLTVIAEGVETSEQSDILGMLGCDAMQGYYFAPPTRVDGLNEMLHAMNRRVSQPRTS